MERQRQSLFCSKAARQAAPRWFCIKPTCFVVASRAAEEAFVNDIDESSPGTEWERVARLCDFNPKSSKQAKDVSRMRSVLISLKQAPLVH